MTWQITLFNWTGFVFIMSCLFIFFSWFAYWLWNSWLEHLHFMWRVSIIAWYQIYGGKNGIRIFKDKNGKEYQIEELK